MTGISTNEFYEENELMRMKLKMAHVCFRTDSFLLLSQLSLNMFWRGGTKEDETLLHIDITL